MLISYALSLAGLGVVAAAAIGASMANLDYPGARLRMVKMIHTSLNKAEVMCRTQRNTFFDALGSAIKYGAMAQTTDLSILALTTKPAYDAGCVPVTLHWKKLFGRGKLGVGLVAGGLVTALSVQTSPIFHIIAVVLAAVAAAWFVFTRTENERSLIRARAEILPEIDRAFSENRYTRYG